MEVVRGCAYRSRSGGLWSCNASTWKKLGWRCCTAQRPRTRTARSVPHRTASALQRYADLGIRYQLLHPELVLCSHNLPLRGECAHTDAIRGVDAGQEIRSSTPTVRSAHQADHTTAVVTHLQPRLADRASLSEGAGFYRITYNYRQACRQASSDVIARTTVGMMAYIALPGNSFLNPDRARATILSCGILIHGSIQSD